MNDNNIGLVEHVNLTGKYDYNGSAYYEAVVYFEHMYPSSLGNYIKRIACLGGKHILEYKTGKYCTLQKYIGQVYRRKELLI